MTKNRITRKQVDEIMEKSEFEAHTFFEKCTVVTMRLPNGFVLVESSSCVDPKDYDFNMGVDACKKRLIEKVITLEAYLLQERIYRESQPTRNINDMTVGEMVSRGFDIDLQMKYDGSVKVDFVNERS